MNEMPNRARPAEQTERRSAFTPTVVLVPLALIALVLTTACVEVRDRQTLTEPGGPDGGAGSSGSLSLQVELLAPDGSESFFIMGREIEIRVRGSEGSGRLRALGYEVRRSGFLRIFHEDEASFASTGSAVETFSYVPPDTLPNPTRLLVRAYAVGDREGREYSDFRELHVLYCPEDAVWC